MPEIKVFLIRGNHDAKNRMTRDLRLPDNVTSLDVDRPQTCHLEDVPVAIHGQGFASQAVDGRPRGELSGGRPRLLQRRDAPHRANGREGHDRYAPCTVEALRAKGYGYWALGHVHTREVLDDRDGPIVFPGNVQGRHIREAGAKGLHARHRRGAPRHLVASSARSTSSDGRLAGSTPRTRPTATTSSGRSRTPCPACSTEADGRLLALRVEVVGASAAHDKLARRQGGLVVSRSGARRTSHGSDRVWVEAVKLRTRPAQDRRRRRGDGPLGELDRLLAELRGDDRLLQEFAGRELADLRKKIPAELRRADAR